MRIRFKKEILLMY